LANNYAIIVLDHREHSCIQRSIEFFSDREVNVYYFDSKEEKYNGKFANNIKYYHVPGANGNCKILNGLYEIKEDYVVLCGVDDFVIPGALKKGYEFLRENKSYKIVTGKFFSFDKDFNGKFLYNYRLLYQYWLKNNLIHNSPEERIKHYLNHYVQLFWVMHEKENLIRIFKLFNKWSLSGYITWEELFLGALILAEGNIKFLPDLFAVREKTQKEILRDVDYIYPTNHIVARNSEHELYKPELEVIKSVIDKEYYVGFTDLILESYEDFYYEYKIKKQEKFKKYDIETCKSVNSLDEIKEQKLLSDEDIVELQKIQDILYGSKW